MSDDATLDEFAETEPDSSETEADDLARKTVCGIPPQDWDVAKLGELARVVSGNSLPTECQNGKEGEHPVYKVSDMNAVGNQKYVSDSSNRLSEIKLKDINHTLYPEGTTILPKVGAALLTNKRRMLTEPSSFDNNVMGWIPEEINPEFLYYVSCMIDMEAVAQKGAVPSISKAIAKSIKLPSTLIPEQRKIATVLHTVDQAIQKTQKIIEQATRVQKGVMQDIFRFGLNRNGELRDSDNGSEPYRETKYGEIPENWNTIPLNQLVPEDAPIVYGILKPGNHQPDGVPVVKVKNIRDGEIKQNEIFHTSEEIHEEYKRAELRKGDLLFSIRGTVGRMAFVPENLDGGNITQDTARIRVTKANPRFVRYFFDTETPKNYFERNTIGQAVQGINLEDLRKVPVHLPSEEEQARIVEIIDQYSKSLRNERDHLQCFHRLKQGLMQDLLSGEVRTTDADIEIPEEIEKHG